MRRGRTGTYGVLPCAPGHPEEKAVPPGNTGHVGLPGAASGVVPGAGSRWHRARLPAWVRWGSGFWVPGQQGCRPGALSPSPGQPPTSGGLALLCGSGWGSIPATLANPVGSGAAGRGPRSPPTDFPAPSPPQPQGVCCRRSQGPRVRVLRAARVPALPHHLRWVPGLQHLPVSAARSREAHQPPRTLGREGRAALLGNWGPEPRRPCRGPVPAGGRDGVTWAILDQDVGPVASAISPLLCQGRPAPLLPTLILEGHPPCLPPSARQPPCGPPPPNTQNVPVCAHMRGTHLWFFCGNVA